MLGNIIKEERTKRGLTQSEFAKILGVSPSTIGMYEQNRRQPDSYTLVKIADYFKVSIDYLLGKADTKQKDSINEYIVPEEFTDPEEARQYISKHTIFGSSGLDTDKLNDEDIVKFANELLEQMKMVSYKYRK